MVDPMKDNDNNQSPMDFDDLIANDADEDQRMERIRNKQGSVHASKLSKDDQPEFMKHLQGQQPVVEKQNITDIMYIGIEDESLQTYKERLLGNLTGNV